MIAELGQEQERKVSPPWPERSHRRRKPKPKEKTTEKPFEPAMPTKAAETKKSARCCPPRPGRGTVRYLQQLVKRLAEGRGYKAIVEKEILGARGGWMSPWSAGRSGSPARFR